jgi:hypothetical protein
MVTEAGGDPLELARAYGKDISAQELMIEEGHDPISVATVIRSSVQSWFGDLDKLRKVRAQLDSLDGEREADVQARLHRLDERIAALEPLEAHIVANEVAALKSLEYPKEKHISRLLELGEIQGVGRPRRLDSEGDVGDLGTLYELTIQPRPLPDGRPAVPVFLHVHTRKPVTAEQCLSLKHDALAAAHVKNARQVNLGARWEEMQNKLGNAEARVRRSKVQGELWAKLRDLARGQPSAS